MVSDSLPRAMNQETGMNEEKVTRPGKNRRVQVRKARRDGAQRGEAADLSRYTGDVLRGGGGGEGGFRVSFVSFRAAAARTFLHGRRNFETSGRHGLARMSANIGNFRASPACTSA